MTSKEIQDRLETADHDYRWCDSNVTGDLIDIIRSQQKEIDELSRLVRITSHARLASLETQMDGMIRLVHHMRSEIARQSSIRFG